MKRTVIILAALLVLTITSCTPTSITEDIDNSETIEKEEIDDDDI